MAFGLTSRKPAGSNPTSRTPSTAEEEVPKFYVPDITTKDLYSAIPRYCFERSLFRSSLYVISDAAWIAFFLWVASTYIPKINPQNVTLPHPVFYKAAREAAWALYGFCAGLPAMGLWVIAHECGHHAFSTSETANEVIGWILHSSLGVPHFSWRVSHNKHHAHTSHLSEDQFYVPKTRSRLGLPPLDHERENLEGTKVSVDLQELLSEALEDAPIASISRLAMYLVLGWPLYLIINAGGQPSHPWFASSSIVYSIKIYGLLNVFRIYLVPYLWANHWLVLVTFLHHTDPALPHYQASSFTFSRGALSTFDRELMGGPGIIGKVTGWICGSITHGICENHVAHHLCSKIPHYHAWEAREAINKRLAKDGIYVQGNPATWSQVMRVLRECKFVEDEGEVRFYKNARGKASRVPVFSGGGVSKP